MTFCIGSDDSKQVDSKNETENQNNKKIDTHNDGKQVDSKNGTENQYDKKIDTHMDNIYYSAMNQTLQENANRSDIGAIISNLKYEPESYWNYGTGFVEQIPNILKDTFHGAMNQPKSGNFFDNSIGFLRGASDGMLSGLQKAMGKATGKELRGKQIKIKFNTLIKKYNCNNNGIFI